MIDFEDMTSGWQTMANTNQYKYRTGLGTHGTKIYAFGSGGGESMSKKFKIYWLKQVTSYLLTQ